MSTLDPRVSPMSTPVLIDTDMGIDDAVAITLALATVEIDVVGLVSVGGNVPLDQATNNIARLLSGLGLKRWPVVGRGLAQNGPEPRDASHVFGKDGLGEIDLPTPAEFTTKNYLDVYEQCIDAHHGKLVIIAIGPLSNLSALQRERPGLLEKAARIIIMGGAVWSPGNVTPYSEFNFYCDPTSAGEVLSSGLPITLVPLDVTRQVALDESHMAHLARSNTKSGELLASMVRYPLERATGPERGHLLVHDALAVSVLLWPELFMQARVGLEVTTNGTEAGRSRPVMVKDKRRQVGVLISVNVTDLLENLLETICHEKFIV
jgi:purine nucleosidase